MFWISPIQLSTKPGPALLSFWGWVCSGWNTQYGKCCSISYEMFLFWLIPLLRHPKKKKSVLARSHAHWFWVPFWLLQVLLSLGFTPPHKAVSLVRVLSREFHPNFLLRVLLDPGRLTYPAKYRLLCLLREQWPLLTTWTLAESDRPNSPWTNSMQASWRGLYLRSVVSLSSPVWARFLVSQFR